MDPKDENSVISKLQAMQDKICGNRFKSNPVAKKKCSINPPRIHQAYVHFTSSDEDADCMRGKNRVPVKAQKRKATQSDYTDDSDYEPDRTYQRRHGFLPRRGRGRPKKPRVNEKSKVNLEREQSLLSLSKVLSRAELRKQNDTRDINTSESCDSEMPKIKRGRGRPRKNENSGMVTKVGSSLQRCFESVNVEADGDSGQGIFELSAETEAEHLLKEAELSTKALQALAFVYQEDITDSDVSRLGLSFGDSPCSSAHSTPSKPLSPPSSNVSTPDKLATPSKTNLFKSEIPDLSEKLVKLLEVKAPLMSTNSVSPEESISLPTECNPDSIPTEEEPLSHNAYSKTRNVSPLKECSRSRRKQNLCLIKREETNLMPDRVHLHDSVKKETHPVKKELKKEPTKVTKKQTNPNKKVGRNPSTALSKVQNSTSSRASLSNEDRTPDQSVDMNVERKLSTALSKVQNATSPRASLSNEDRTPDQSVHMNVGRKLSTALSKGQNSTSPRASLSNEDRTPDQSVDTNVGQKLSTALSKVQNSTSPRASLSKEDRTDESVDMNVGRKLSTALSKVQNATSPRARLSNEDRTDQSVDMNKFLPNGETDETEADVTKVECQADRDGKQSRVKPCEIFRTLEEDDELKPDEIEMESSEKKSDDQHKAIETFTENQNELLSIKSESRNNELPLNDNSVMSKSTPNIGTARNLDKNRTSNAADRTELNKSRSNSTDSSNVERGVSSPGKGRLIERKGNFSVTDQLEKPSIAKRQFTVTPNNWFTCDKCGTIFKFLSTYTYHVAMDCNTSIVTLKSVERRLPIESAAGLFQCPQCPKQVSSRASLMVHLRLHSGERPFQCKQCPQAFFQNHHLQDHYDKTHLNPKTFLCRSCGENILGYNTWRTHMTKCKKREQDIKKDRDAFPCRVCGESCKSKEDLYTHQISHVGLEKPFACTLCHRYFHNEELLARHVNTHAQEYACNTCGKKFTCKTRLRSHQARHEGDLSFKCNHCEAKFYSAYELKCHERKHTDERPFPCPVCHKKFRRKTTMEVHLTLHTGAKPFVCTECGEKFNRNIKLQVHYKQTHSGETFDCALCSKSFPCKSYLIPHLRVHTGEKPFSCSLCAVRFNRSYEIGVHMRKHHQEDPRNPYVRAFVNVDCEVGENAQAYFDEEAIEYEARDEQMKQIVQRKKTISVSKNNVGRQNVRRLKQKGQHNRRNVRNRVENGERAEQNDELILPDSPTRFQEEPLHEKYEAIEDEFEKRLRNEFQSIDEHERRLMNDHCYVESSVFQKKCLNDSLNKDMISSEARFNGFKVEPFNELNNNLNENNVGNLNEDHHDTIENDINSENADLNSQIANIGPDSEYFEVPVKVEIECEQNYEKMNQTCAQNYAEINQSCVQSNEEMNQSCAQNYQAMNQSSAQNYEAMNQSNRQSYEELNQEIGVS